MGDFRNDCCEPCEPCDCLDSRDCCEPCEPRRMKCECCCRPVNCCNDNDGENGLGIIILLVVLYFLFCSGDNNGRGGGLFGGLF